MQQLLGKNVRSVILTSGTLAPLKPLISELGIPIDVRLENPHIVTSAQVCVKIVSSGPDKERLISNYENRWVSRFTQYVTVLIPIFQLQWQSKIHKLTGPNHFIVLSYHSAWIARLLYVILYVEQMPRQLAGQWNLVSNPASQAYIHWTTVERHVCSDHERVLCPH